MKELSHELTDDGDKQKIIIRLCSPVKMLLLEACWKMNMIQHLLSCKRPYIAMRKMPFYSATEHLWKEAKSRLQYSYECIFTCIFKVILVRLLQVGGKPLRQWQIATERQKNNAVRISIIGKMIPYAESRRR